MSPGDRSAKTKREVLPVVSTRGQRRHVRPHRSADRPRPRCDTNVCSISWPPWASPWRSGGRRPTTTAASPCSSPRRSSSTATSASGSTGASSSSTSTPGESSTRCRPRRTCRSASPSTPTGGAATPASYCFARPTHEYLGLGIGEDFERKLVVKVNAVERVRAELRSPRWHGDHIAMGTNTDPYQRAEGRYHLTRGIVEALGRRPQSLLHPHQVDADPARPRPPRRRRERAPTCTATSPSARSTKTCGRRPSRGRPIPGAGSRPCAGSTTPASPPGSSWRPIIPGLVGRTRAARRGRHGLRGGRGHLRDPHPPASASGGEGALPRLREGASSRASRRPGPPLRPFRLSPPRRAGGHRRRVSTPWWHPNAAVAAAPTPSATRRRRPAPRPDRGTGPPSPVEQLPLFPPA